MGRSNSWTSASPRRPAFLARAHTATGVLKGKVPYMSPEYALGSDVDARSDLYSLGVLFFKAVSGHTPFHAGTDLALLKLITEQPAPRLEERLGEFDGYLSDWTARLLAKQPDQRPASAREVSAQLETWLSRHSDPSRLREQLAAQIGALLPARRRELQSIAKRRDGPIRGFATEQLKQRISALTGSDSSQDGLPVRRVGAAAADPEETGAAPGTRALGGDERRARASAEDETTVAVTERLAVASTEKLAVASEPTVMTQSAWKVDAAVPAGRSASPWRAAVSGVALAVGVFIVGALAVAVSRSDSPPPRLVAVGKPTFPLPTPEPLPLPATIPSSAPTASTNLSPPRPPVTTKPTHRSTVPAKPAVKRKRSCSPLDYDYPQCRNSPR